MAQNEKKKTNKQTNKQITIALFSKDPRPFKQPSLNKHYTVSLGNEYYTHNFRYLNNMFRHCNRGFFKLYFNVHNKA